MMADSKTLCFVFKASNYTNRADIMLIVTDLKVTDLLATNLMVPQLTCFKLSWDAPTYCINSKKVSYL